MISLFEFYIFNLSYSIRKGKNLDNDIRQYKLIVCNWVYRGNKWGLKYAAKWFVSNDFSLFFRKGLRSLRFRFTFIAYASLSEP